jgi:23S rRNA (uracil1939-C5)-methyltransferase
MKKGDELELEIQKYAFEGKGIAKINLENEAKNNFVVFVNGAYPGDKVLVRLAKIKKNYAEAKAVNILLPSADRVKPLCKYFGVCGGCKQQDLNYAKQTEYKQQQVEEIFTKLGGFQDLTIEPIIPAEKTFYYRNKMEFSFAEKRWLTEKEIQSGEVIERDFALGLHAQNNFDKALDIDECFLQSEISNKIMNFTRDFFKPKNSTIYSTKTHSGYLRNLVIKQSHHLNELMVNLVTSIVDSGLMNEYTKQLLSAIPEITTLINNINTKKALIAIGDFENVLYGSGYIYDSIGEFKFRISTNSFFQTNTLQAEKLYSTALEFAQLTGNEIVYDLYSGAGTISIFVSKCAKDIYGFEVVHPAVEDAQVNKKINDIENVHFFEADLYSSFLPLVGEKKIPKPDVIILDPPRSGMHKNTVDDVIKLNAQRIVYVSCNPTTQVRDIKLFTEAGYKLIKIRPVDMFPHTYHIENVALLER